MNAQREPTQEPSLAPAPSSIEAEELLIGCALQDETTVDHAAALIQPRDFYRVRNRQVWEVIVSLRKGGIVPDYVAVAAAVKAAGHWAEDSDDHLLRCLTSVVAVWPGRVQHYAAIIRECATRRQLSILGAEIQQRAGSVGPVDLIAAITSRVEEIASRADRVTDPGITASIGTTLGQIEERRKLGGALVGLPTGFTALDSILGGLQNSDLVILAARPSIGKTAFALNVIETAGLVAQVPSLVISLEMSRSQLVTRLLSSLGSIPHQALRSGTLADTDWPKLAGAAGRLAGTGLQVEDRPALTVPEIRLAAGRAVNAARCGLVVVDYLQLVKGDDSENRNLEVGAVTRGLKAIAKELDVPVLALAQLSRAVEKRTDRRPILSDLRDSGEIEAHADVVMFLHRETRPRPGEEHVAELIVAKQRNGPTGVVDLHWEGKFMRFENSREQAFPGEPDWRNR